MNRRTFASAVAGLIASGGAGYAAPVRRYAIRPFADARRAVVVLEAVVAPRLPESFALVETDMGDLEGPDIEARPLPALFEIRTYGAQVHLRAAGSEPWLTGNGRYLIPFESLSHREQTWREATAQRVWPAYEFAIYRPVAVLRTT
jgi:hypothetical protein